MNIKGNSSFDRRPDITRPNRQAIESRKVPLPSKPEGDLVKNVDETVKDKAQQVKEARDEYRAEKRASNQARIADIRPRNRARRAEKRQTRIANARQDYTERQNIRLEKREIAQNRKVYNKNNPQVDPPPADVTGAKSIETGAGDGFAVSSTSRALSAGQVSQDTPERVDYVRGLKQKLSEGKLNTDELIARTAARILGARDEVQ